MSRDFSQLSQSISWSLLGFDQCGAGDQPLCSNLTGLHVLRENYHCLGSDSACDVYEKMYRFQVDLLESYASSRWAPLVPGEVSAHTIAIHCRIRGYPASQPANQVTNHAAAALRQWLAFSSWCSPMHQQVTAANLLVMGLQECHEGMGH